MRYVIYGRVSTVDQKVENQLKECRLYCRSKMQEGDTLIEFHEPDMSSRVPIEGRLVLQQMLAELKRGDTLVVYKLDRLARDKQELVNIYLDLIKKKKVNIYSIHEPAADEEWILIIALIASKERENVRTRTISALNRKRADGERVGTAIYGYRLDESRLQLKDARARSYGKPYILVPDEREQAVISLILRLRDEGLSFRKILAYLDEHGITNREGKRFHLNSLCRIIHRADQQAQPLEMSL